MLKYLMKIFILVMVIFITSFSSANAAKNTVLDFDGTSDYVTVADNEVLDQADRLSISVWIEPDDLPAGDEYIAYRYNNYYLKINSSGNIIGSVNTDSARVTSATAITTDGATWTHIEMTYDKDAGGTDEIKLYINGVLDATGDYSTAISVSAEKLYIGVGDTAGDDTPENFFDGQIDDLALYQYARSADDVRLDYNEGLAIHLGPVLKNCAQDPASCMDYGLVGSWGMDEGAGTIAYDASDNVNDGTLIGGPVWTNDSPSTGSGGQGGSLSFDGMDDYVDAGNDASLSLISDMTIEAWIMPAANNSNKGIITKSLDDNLNRWFLYLTTSGGMGQIAIGMNIGGAGWVSAGSGIIPEINHWYHIIATRDSTNYLSIYVNGVYSNGVQGYSGNPDAPIRIGKYYYSQGYFNGSIDSVRIYNRALSAEEVRYHYNKGGPVAHWKFDEGEGTKAFDSSINRNNGILTNMDNSDWVSGKFGSALNFDGSDDYVDVGYSSILDFKGANKSFTVEAWIFSNSLTIDSGIIGRFNGMGGYQYDLKFESDTNDIKFAVFDGDFQIAESVENTILANTWIHVVGTANNGVLKVYINGVSSGTTDTYSTITDIGTGINISIGTENKDSGGSGANFDGLIDEIKIYNYALTAEQVKMEYNGGAVRFE